MKILDNSNQDQHTERRNIDDNSRTWETIQTMIQKLCDGQGAFVDAIVRFGSEWFI